MREAGGEVPARGGEREPGRRRGGGVTEKGRPPPQASGLDEKMEAGGRAVRCGPGGRRAAGGDGDGGEGAARPVSSEPSVQLRGEGTSEAWPASRGGRRHIAGAPEEAPSRRPVSS